MIGLLKSLSRKPTARSIERFGARCMPSVISLLRRFSAIGLSPWTERISSARHRPGTGSTEFTARLSLIRRRWEAASDRCAAQARARHPALGLCRDELFAAAFDPARLFHARSWSRFRVGGLPQLDFA